MVTGDLIGNRIVTNDHDKQIPNEEYISPEERQNIINDARLT